MPTWIFRLSDTRRASASTSAAARETSRLSRCGEGALCTNGPRTTRPPTTPRSAADLLCTNGPRRSLIRRAGARAAAGWLRLDAVDVRSIYEHGTMHANETVRLQPLREL